METVKEERKKLNDIVMERLEKINEFSIMFDEYVRFAMEKVVDAKQFAILMMGLLRRSLVWIDPSKVEAATIELGQWNEVIVRLKMPSCEIRITRHGAEVLEPSIYFDHD